MQDILKKIIKPLKKFPLLILMIITLFKSFLIFICSFGIIFVILYVTGVYANLEIALNLKYNSPMVLALMWLSAILCLLSFVIGFLMYFHKYKRSKSKTLFYKQANLIFSEQSKLFYKK